MAAGDYAAAERLWRAEAAAGSAEAMQGLGILFDLGLGRPGDREAALEWYRRAAEAGLAAGAFNVGAVLDSGVGGARDPAAAAVWYARAAASGHARAQYNLGLMYAAGDGVPQNVDLARIWLSASAAAAPAARARLRALGRPPAAARRLQPPQDVSAVRMGDDVVVAWTSGPAPRGARFHVSLIHAAGGHGGLRQAQSAFVEASAIRLPGPVADEPAYVRVAVVDRAGASYAAGPWRPLDGGPAPALRGRAVFRVLRGDGDAAQLAAMLTPALAAGGIACRTEFMDRPPPESAVAYRYASDAAIAQEIAGFLPALAPDSARRDLAADLTPGEIEIYLRFAPQSD